MQSTTIELAIQSALFAKQYSYQFQLPIHSWQIQQTLQKESTCAPLFRLHWQRMVWLGCWKCGRHLQWLSNATEFGTTIEYQIDAASYLMTVLCLEYYNHNIDKLYRRWITIRVKTSRSWIMMRVKTNRW